MAVERARPLRIIEGKTRSSGSRVDASPTQSLVLESIKREAESNQKNRELAKGLLKVACKKIGIAPKAFISDLSVGIDVRSKVITEYLEMAEAEELESPIPGKISRGVLMINEDLLKYHRRILETKRAQEKSSRSTQTAVATA